MAPTKRIGSSSRKDKELSQDIVEDPELQSGNSRLQSDGEEEHAQDSGLETPTNPPDQPTTQQADVIALQQAQVTTQLQVAQQAAQVKNLQETLDNLVKLLSGPANQPD